MIGLVRVNDRDERSGIGEGRRLFWPSAKASEKAFPVRRARPPCPWTTPATSEKRSLGRVPGMIGALFCGLTDELGHRFAFDRGGTLHLLVEFGIQSQTSCSQGIQLLLLLRGQLDDVLGLQFQMDCVGSVSALS